MFLTPQDLIELTKKRRHDAQARALRFMGIEFKPRPDGSLAVLRAHVEKQLGEGVSTTERAEKKTEPNWAALEEWERRKTEKKPKT